MESTLILDTMISTASASELNVEAPEFVPRYMISDPQMGERVDDILRSFHHLATVNDTETLLQAKTWLGEDPDEWLSTGLEYTYGYEGLSEMEAYYLDLEQSMRGRLYVPPAQEKGNTSGRMRVR